MGKHCTEQVFWGYSLTIFFKNFALFLYDVKLHWVSNKSHGQLNFVYESLEKMGFCFPFLKLGIEI